MAQASIATRSQRVRAVNRELSKLDLQGVVRPDLNSGHLGTSARALGGAVNRISFDYMTKQHSTLLGARRKHQLATVHRRSRQIGPHQLCAASNSYPEGSGDSGLRTPAAGRYGVKKLLDGLLDLLTSSARINQRGSEPR